MNAHKDEAVELLIHYFEVAGACPPGGYQRSDFYAEIRKLVDCIVSAALEELRPPPNPRGETMNSYNATQERSSLVLPDHLAAPRRELIADGYAPITGCFLGELYHEFFSDGDRIARIQYRVNGETATKVLAVTY